MILQTVPTENSQSNSNSISALIFSKRTSAAHSTNVQSICRVVIACFILAILSPGIVLAQSGLDNDDIVRSLKNGNYPWYDKAQDSANFEAEFSGSDEAETKERNKVAKGKKARPNVSTPSSAPGSGGAFGWGLVLFLVSGAIIGFVIWLLLKMEPESAQGYRLEDMNEVSFGSDRIEQLPFDVKNVTGDFRSAAEHAANAGRFGEAMVNLFSHILLTLDKHGKVRLKRGKTNRQYSSELGRNHGLRNYYEQVMVFYESTFFGNHEIQKQQFDLCWNELPKFQQKLLQDSELKNG